MLPVAGDKGTTTTMETTIRLLNLETGVDEGVVKTESNVAHTNHTSSDVIFGGRNRVGGGYVGLPAGRVWYKETTDVA